MRTPSLTTRTVGILLCSSFALMLFLASLHSLLDGLSLPSINIFSLHPEIPVDVQPMRILVPRQGVVSTAPVSNAATPTPATTPTTSSTPHETSTTSTPASSPSAQPSPSTTPSPTAQSSSPTSTSTEPANTPTTSTTPHSTVPPTTSAILTTNQGGQTITSIVVISDQASSSSAPSSSSSPASPPPSGGGGTSSSTIIGLSVAGGVAIMGIIGFFVWKFTRKRRNEFNDNEEIKWPELNAHDQNAPLPTHRTGGAGIDTNDIRRSSLGYAPSTAANSTAELYPDPYAVPPLPHLDPNQAYHDDPNGRFYDPYNGPVPATFEGVPVPGESIPMTQFAGRRSPGPGAAFGADLAGGRASPAPQGPYDFGGRASPAPAYGGGGGRASPGPNVAYAAGRASPAPQAYGNYGPR